MSSDPLSRIRRGLAPRSRAGQCFCIGLAGESISREERELIATMAPGAFILARRNLASRDQSLQLLDELSALTVEACGIPPLFAADEEGGFVQQTDRFGAAAPSPLAVARAGRPDQATRLARAVGHRLRALGIPLAFAPVADVNDLAANPVIGVRSFGSEPGVVSAYARAWLAGLREAGVFGTAKHFPGHGSTSLDSHRDLPTLEEHDRARLERFELPPFRAAIADGVPAIMTAHVAFPRVDPAAEMPATLVPFFTRRLLREELGFGGLLVSDDLGMKAIRDHFPPREVARLGRAAGLDLLLFALDRDLAVATWEALVAGADSARIDPVDLEASVARILRMKADWLGIDETGRWGERPAWRDGAPSFERADGDVAELAVTIAHESVLVASETPGPPWTPRVDDRVAVIVITGSAGGSDFHAGLVAPLVAARRGRAEIIEIAGGIAERTSSTRETIDRVRGHDRMLVVVFSRGPLSPADRALVVELAKLDRPLAVLSVLQPLDLPALPGLRLQAASFGYSRPALEAAIDRLWGR